MTVNQQLLDHLSTGCTTTCFVWVITKTDGVRIGFTDHDNDIEFDGVTCFASPGMKSTRYAKSLSLNADDVEIDGAIDGTVITVSDLRKGLYDNADAKLYLVNWSDTTQSHMMTSGNFGNVIEKDEGRFSTEFLSKSVVMSQPKGRTFQRTCQWKLGDSKCGVDLDTSAFKLESTVTSVTGTDFTIFGASAFEDGWFDLGKLTVDGNLVMDIREHKGDIISTWRQPPVAISASAPVIILAGCKQSIAVCSGKFDNALRFGGFPYVPGTDRLVSYPIRGQEPHDGGSLINEGTALSISGQGTN